MTRPLAGIKVLELAGLAPAPYCGMVLADFGADVVRVDRTGGDRGVPDTLARGKRSIAINLQSSKGQSVFKRLVDKNDVLIEPYRPGVMEKLGLAPETLCEQNKKLVYVRLNGYGRLGEFSKKAGHDINYLAMSGVLSRLGRKGEKPTPPVNLLADFAGGGMIAAIGVVTALFERQRSGLGQVVEASVTEGASYISSFLQCSRDMGIWMGERGSNLLDTGAPFYDTYATKDGRYMAVGAIEPQFYQRFLTGLGREDLAGKEYKISEWPEVKEEIAKTFLTKTFEEWTEIFAPIDACVTPVIDLYEAPHHPHNISSESFMKDGDNFNPSPAPRLSRTPAVNKCRPLPHTVGEHTRDVLLEYGFQQAEINDLIEENHVEEPKLPSSKL